MFSLIYKTGYGALSPLRYFIGMILNTYLVITSFLVERRYNKRLPVRTTSFQIFFTGIQALPIIIMAGLVLGAAVIIELTTILPVFGASKYVERLSVIVLSGN